jgi:putative lipoprotein
MRYLSNVLCAGGALCLATVLAYGQTDQASGAWLDKQLTNWNQVGGVLTPVSIAMNKNANAGGNVGAQQGTITGTVTYRMRIALVPNAVVKVQLLDVARADAPATVIAEQIIETKGKQVPIPFSLTYDPAQIKQNQRYQVRAQIMIDGNLAFTSIQAYPVITGGNPQQVTILVQPPARGGGSATDQARPDQPNAELENTRWKLIEVNGRTVTTPAGAREVFIRLNQDKKVLEAMGGCNGLGGNYEITGEQVRFTGIMGTMMACSELPTEQALIKALEATNKFKIIGDKLELYADNKLLARLVALHLK